MDTIDRARHELEVADVSERKLRLRALELSIASGVKPEEITGLATTFFNFLIGQPEMPA